MSKASEHVEMALVQAIFTQAAARAIGERKGQISFEGILEQSVAAAQVMSRAHRSRQNDGQDEWLKSMGR